MAFLEKKIRRVLIVDDDEVSSIALGKRLERRGFDITYLNQAHDLMNTLAASNIELLVLDIVMPEIDGMAALKMVREKYGPNELVIIMVTAIDDSFDIVESFKLGANDYITKPVNIDVATARFHAHLSAVDLALATIRKSEIEAINAMIITYHHEINNPLTVACGALSILEKKSVSVDQTSLLQIDGALKKITAIVKAIRELSENEQVQFEKYVGEKKMITIKKTGD